MKKIVFSLILALNGLVVFGQTKTSSANNWQDKFFKNPETTLPLLINAATKNSYELHRIDAQSQMAQEQLKLTKKQIYSNVSLGSGVGYGTRLGNFSDVNGVNIRPYKNYNVGINAGISLTNILGRKHQIKMGELSIQQIEDDRNLGERTIRQNIISAYQNLSLAKVVLDNSQEALQTALVSKNLATKQFREGDIQVVDQMSVNQMYNSAVVQQKQALNTFQTSVLLLEEMIGMKLNDLMN
ncbi:MAG: hypothetical protein COW65_15745 [Cytophagales bacterium CG18_big_fil_WC_8_21_14_2_50_42_9]|nr:MAG: hypothetical protein COW65_15745 [Cytophagales bacterium CG18_big_fil_WC_8_21_14_2_50_42_9]